MSVAEQRTRTGLDALFLPDSVAVIGATKRAGTVGRTILENLLHPSFLGKVFAVNSRHTEICGRKAYPAVGDISDKVDLAVVATPAPTIPGIIRQCVDAGVKSTVVISAGFRGRGAEGVELERQIQERPRVGNMRLIGPNCLGIMNPSVGLNATFALAMCFQITFGSCFALRVVRRNANVVRFDGGRFQPRLHDFRSTFAVHRHRCVVRERR